MLSINHCINISWGEKLLGPPLSGENSPLKIKPIHGVEIPNFLNPTSCIGRTPPTRRLPDVITPRTDPDGAVSSSVGSKVVARPTYEHGVGSTLSQSLCLQALGLLRSRELAAFSGVVKTYSK